MPEAFEDLVRSLWRDREGRIFKCIGMIRDPAVVLEDVKSGEQQTLVLGSRIYQEYERLRPEPKEEA